MISRPSVKRGAMALALCGILAAVWLTQRRSSPTLIQNAYLDSRQCRACHSEIYTSYQHVGMARAFASVNGNRANEDFERNNRFVHAASGRHYEIQKRGDRVVQRRFELNSQGKEVNAFELEATHVVGSGNHARTYLHRSEAGEFTELPMTWYSQENRWAMSPGFDTSAPPDFIRMVDDRCLFCHNGYPRPDGSLAEGIDCQRCHGPGQRHVQLASSGTATPGEAAAAIVNPAKLTPERELDVCMQCHLETTSTRLPSMIRRFDRDVHSFRPGESLAEYAVQFDETPGTGRPGRFEIASQAYRLRQSACFLGAQDRLTCSSCHNAHSAVRGEEAVSHFRAKCRGCHANVAAAGHPKLESADCVSCHMPRRRTEDAVHVVMTDHLIQRRPPQGNLTRAIPEQSHPPAQPAVYYPPRLPAAEEDLYLGAALITNGNHIRAGIERLERHATIPARATAVLGEAYLAEGNATKAVETFRRALAQDPNLNARHNLGQALELTGNLHEAAEQYREALRRRPAFPEAEYALANVLAKIGDTNSAAEHYWNATRLRPTYREAHSNLGTLYADQGNLPTAQASLEEALRIDPNLADAHINLARVLAAQSNILDALTHARRAVTIDGKNAVGRYNLAQLLQHQGSSAAAIAEYRSAIALRPDLSDAHLGLGQILGDAGQLDAAIAEFREALRLRPGHAETQRNLDTALAMKRR